MAILPHSVVERVPGWPDRILYHSLPSRAGELVPEPMDDGSYDNYHAVEAPLDFTEHSPVFCTFDLEIDADDIPTAAGGVPESASDAEADTDAFRDLAVSENGPSVALAALASPSTSARLLPAGTDMPVNVILTVHKVVIEYRGQMRPPRAINILFPLPFEDSDSLPERAKSMRAGGIAMGGVDKSTLVSATTKMLVSRASRVQRFHLLLKVSLDDGTKAQCVVCMRDAGLVPPGPVSTTLLQPLHVRGVPLVSKNGKVRAVVLLPVCCDVLHLCCAVLTTVCRYRHSR